MNPPTNTSDQPSVPPSAGTRHARINGFPVFVGINLDAGKEVTEAHALKYGGSRRINGPHHNAKWAQHLLGTDMTAGQRRKATGRELP